MNYGINSEIANTDFNSNFDKIFNEMHERMKLSFAQFLLKELKEYRLIKPKANESIFIERLKFARTSHGIILVDNITGYGYEMINNNYTKGILKPYTRILNFTFERWCRSFDL